MWDSGPYIGLDGPSYKRRDFQASTNGRISESTWRDPMRAPCMARAATWLRTAPWHWFLLKHWLAPVENSRQTLLVDMVILGYKG